MSRDSSLGWMVDLVAIAVYAPAALGVLVVLDPANTLVRTLLVLPLALFVPGYAIVSLFYPEQYEFDITIPFGLGQPQGETLEGVTPTAGMAPLSRLLISVGLSIIVVPIVAIGLDFLVGLYWLPTFATVTGLTVLASAAALVARARVPTENRFSVTTLVALYLESDTYGEPLGGSQSSSSRFSAYTSPGGILMASGAVVLVGSVLFAALLPVAGIPGPGATDFSELYLTTQNESGEYIMADYPSDFQPGESQSVFVTVQNNEGEDVEYTVVAALQRAEVSDGETTVEGQQELERFSQTVEAGETARFEHAIQPTQQGRFRVVYLLYKGDPPSTPTTENAYRSTHLWIDVGGQGDRTAPLSSPQRDEPSSGGSTTGES